MGGKMKLMMRGKVLFAGALMILAALVRPAGLAGADQQCPGGDDLPLPPPEVKDCSTRSPFYFPCGRRGGSVR
jgi:hypothetical protein